MASTELIELPRLPKLKSPQWRLASAMASADSHVYGKCDYIDSLVNLLLGQGIIPYVEEAYLLYTLPHSRTIVDSLLLTSPPIAPVAKALGTSEQCIEFYSKCFFDTAVFPNKLLLREYVLSRPESTPEERTYKASLQAAYSLGYKYILWRNSMDSDPGLYDPKEMSDTMLKDAYWRSREHLPFGIGSDVAKESKSWAPQALRAVDKKLAEANTTSGASELLRLRLVKVDTTVARDKFMGDIKG